MTIRMPATRASTNESWEVIETARRVIASDLDLLVQVTADCECPHAADAIEHYDELVSIVHDKFGFSAPMLSSLLAEAVTRLAAERKRAES